MAESDCDYFKRVNKETGETLFAILGPAFSLSIFAVFLAAALYLLASGLLSLEALINVIHPMGYATEMEYKTDFMPGLLKYGLCPATGSKASAFGWTAFWGLILASLPGPRYYKGMVACVLGRRQTK